MKNILFAFLFLVLSCSGDDDSGSDPVVWSIRISVECPSSGPGTCYEVSKERGEQVVNGVVAGDPCQMVSFKDLDGVTRQGYFKSGGSGSCN